MKKQTPTIKGILNFVDSYCKCLTDGKWGLDDVNRHEIRQQILAILDHLEIEEDICGMPVGDVEEKINYGFNMAVKELKKRIGEIKK